MIWPTPGRGDGALSWETLGAGKTSGEGELFPAGGSGFDSAEAGLHQQREGVRECVVAVWGHRAQQRARLSGAPAQPLGAAHLGKAKRMVQGQKVAMNQGQHHFSHLCAHVSCMHHTLVYKVFAQLLAHCPLVISICI